MSRRQASYRARRVPAAESRRLREQGFDALMARLLASRGVRDASDVEGGLAQMLGPAGLARASEAGELLARAVIEARRVCVVADYDCDGACACAIVLRALGMLGAAPGSTCYVVPDRRVDGYGLTPAVVERAHATHAPAVLVTVDNGIASFEGVERAHELGMRVIVTDHHLPASVDGQVRVPDADVVVDPCQPGCGFASKALCGAGVAFYVALATRAALRRLGRFDASSQPRLDSLLDLVALATVADVVRLDANNRRLVAAGLERIRSDACQPGICELFRVAGRARERATSTDLAYTIAPRVNAAGRLADMTVGVECLLSDDADRAAQLAEELQRINAERRGVQARMSDDAALAIQERAAAAGATSDDAAIVVGDETFHEGVVGIVAGRIKDREHRPTFVFARALDGSLKGSGRSIEGFHLRDALDLVAKREPGLVLRFGGHAMAAGCTIDAAGLDRFRHALAEVAREWLTPEMLERVVATDGPLAAGEFSVRTARRLGQVVWGHGFDEPVFVDRVHVLEQRVVGSGHLKLAVRVGQQRREAVWFGRSEPLAGDVPVDLAYRVALNEWRGVERVQMVVEGLAGPAAG